MLFYNSNSVTLATSSETNSGNNFSNLSFTGATTISGWVCGDGTTSSPYGPSKTITNNTFNNITVGTSAAVILTCSYSNSGSTTNNFSGNTVSNITGGGAITGITSVQGSQNIFNNTVTGLSTTGAAAVSAIVVSGGATQNIYNNTVCNIQANNAAGTVNGILISGGVLANVYNNRIADLRAPASSGANMVNGISVTAGTTANIYYNTVFLNATSSGAIFGSSAASISTTPTVTLRNNIFINTSTPNTTGFTVAYRRSSNTLTTYAAASNNNLFYAGTPGANNFIFYDGTNNDQLLSAFKTRVSTRDANSITENTTFLSTTCGNSNFLKVNPAIQTLTESAGRLHIWYHR